MELHLALKDLVDRLGPAVIDDPTTVRAVLDDVLDEDTATVGDLNLLVDAVRLGAVSHLLRVLDSGAEAGAAVAMAGATLARDRGGSDPAMSSWACAVLGFAVGRVPESVVHEFRPTGDQRSAAPPVVPASAPPPAPAPAAAPSASSADPPATPPTRVAPPVDPDTPVGRRSWVRVVAVVAVVLLAVGLGVVGTYLLTDDTGGGTDNEAAADDGGTSESAETPVQCWDGTGAQRLSDCSLPTDEAGLAWVFPDADDGSCEPVARGINGRVIDRFCPVELPGGATAQFHYSQWRNPISMRGHYLETQLGQDVATDRDDLQVLDVTDPRAPYKLVVYYRLSSTPWSVAIYAVSASDLDAALAELKVRPVDQLRGLGRRAQQLPTSFGVTPAPQ